MTLYGNDFSGKKIGEILVRMNLANDNQILTASIEAKTTHSRTGSTLVKQGIITLDQLKYALKLQLGFDAVSEEQISLLDPKSISFLPEDFIKMFKAVPIALDDKSITIGMVNPNDKAAIYNIISYTNKNPKILILTFYEYQMIIKKFF